MNAFADFVNKQLIYGTLRSAFSPLLQPGLFIFPVFRDLRCLGFLRDKVIKTLKDSSLKSFRVTVSASGYIEFGVKVEFILGATRATLDTMLNGHI